MNVWRIQLKPVPAPGFTYEDVLQFCMKEHIIGVGWANITCAIDNAGALRSEIYNTDFGYSKTSAFKGINAMRQMRPGDLIWTRLGQDASEYYLCRVGGKLWKDREITQRHIEHDICQYVSATWIPIGKEDRVPGKVINSFISRSCAQRVNDITEISKTIWNKHCSNPTLHYTDLGVMNFWDAINSEDLECMVLLYLQHLGNYIYSSTLKQGTAKYETIMVSKDGKTRLYPQVKRVTSLPAGEYTGAMGPNEKAVLFTTSEMYGEKQFDNVICITKAELEAFMREQYILLPDSVKYWIEMTDFK